MTSRAFSVLAVGALLFAGLQTTTQADEPLTGPAILQELRSFAAMGTILHVAAHPDDENTQLITYFARGRGFRAAYLSVTRGDGGQNVLGPEFFSTLGAIRTQELLAARRLDGGRQFFTRAIDFGFSKDYRETLNIWDKQQVVSDIVRVIRSFRPDVIVTRFSTEAGNTHGHHTASAVLAVEAFPLAGDPKTFPEQLKDLAPWQPKRIFMNAGGGGLGTGGAVRVEVGGNDPVLGQSFGEIAGRSRAMHKSQGFGAGGVGKGGGAKTETFQLLRGDPATKDIFDGIDTTWGRVPNGGAEIAKLTDEVIAKFDAKDPSASVPGLLALRTKLTALPPDRLIDEKRQQFDRILQACLGLQLETTVPQSQVVPGEKIQLKHTVALRSNVPVRLLGARYPVLNNAFEKPVSLKAGGVEVWTVERQLPARMPLSQPYWLREEGTVGMFRVDDPSLIGLAENPPAFPVEYLFEVGGQNLILADEPVQAMEGKSSGRRIRLEVIAPVGLNFASEVRLFAPGASRPVAVDVTPFRANIKGDLKLDTPPGWKIEPASQPFQLASVGKPTRLTFNVTAPSQAASARLTARAQIGDATFENEHIEVNYDHIPPILLQPRARDKTLSLDMAVRGKQVGYIPGAGDSVAECLEEMGYRVTPLTGADLTPEKLKDLDAVVVGIRALNVRTDLGGKMPALFAFVEAGGNLIMQYNNPNGLKVNQFAPYDIKISQDRVTDETAVMTFLAPDHPVLNTPNKITAADFDGWVQERGLYFPNQWDERFVPILACNDPALPTMKGSLLVARYGKGNYIYTGLAWFRQLPAGVPGAYRIFANMVSLGKQPS